MNPHWRWAHRLYAWLAGYFWLPCPLCGAHFGGHEWREIDGKPDAIIVEAGTNWAKRTAICPRCTLAGRGQWAWAPRSTTWETSDGQH
jgi:hypothetical protein